MRCSAIAFAAALLVPATAVSAQAPVPALPRAGAIELLDNARGTAWDVIYPPGIPTPLHRHDRDFVGVELVAATVQITDASGVHMVELPRGAMYMRRRGTIHVELGPVGKPQRNSMIVELKDGPSPAYPASPGAPPAGFVTQGTHNAVDNERLTIWDASWTPGAHATAFYQSRDIFLIPIDPGVLVIATDDQPASPFPLAGGQVLFLPGGHRLTIEAAHGAVRAAVIELK